MIFNYKLFILYSMIQIGLTIPTKRSLSNEAKPCCIPKEFSAKIILSTVTILTDGRIIPLYSHYNFSYDGNRQMTGMKGISYRIDDQQETKLWIIENSNDGQIYTIDLQTNRCHKTTMPIKTIECIPDDAIYIDSSTYGYDQKTILADTWLVKTDQMINYATVSRHGCIPLTSNVFLNQQPQIINSLTTTDYQSSIEDPTLFDIPQECLQETSTF